jgi:hypothetical protein
MIRPMARLAILLAALSAGCGSSTPSLGLAVALTLRADNSVSDDALASVRSVAFHASGGETFDGTDTVSGLARTERVVYRPASETRALQIEIDALDATMNVVASGNTGPLAIDDGKTDAVTVTLSAPSAAPDGGVDLRGEDLRGADLNGVCAGAYCYTFEGNDDSPSLQVDPGCTIVDNPAQAHSGSSYLSCTSSGSPATGSGTINAGSGQPLVYMRAWIRVTSANGTPQFSNLTGITTVGFTNFMDFGDDGAGLYALIYNNGSNASQISSAQAFDTAGTWRCFELLADRSVAPPVLTFYLDDIAVNQVSDDVQSDAYTFVQIGISKDSQTDDPVQMTVDTDDVIIAYSRIGCQ